MLNSQYIKSYIFTFITIAILFIVWVFLKPKKHTQTPQERYNSLLKKGSITPVAFTYDFKDGKYVNYYVDTATGTFVEKIEDYPVDDSGNLLQPTSKILKPNENGYKITGVDADFSCPAYWTWNGKTCVSKNPCSGVVTPQNRPIYNEIGIASLRKYIYCNSDTDYVIKTCTGPKIYKDGAGCQFYDVCTEMKEFDRHTIQVSDYNLAIDQYYTCRNKTSVLSTCDNGQVFNKNLNLCAPREVCLNKPDGYIANSSANSYVYCLQGKDITVNCPYGVYNGKECLNRECVNPELVTFTNYYEKSPFKIPISFKKCTNNTVTTINVPLKLSEPFNRDDLKFLKPYQVPTKTVNITGEIIDINTTGDLEPYTNAILQQTKDYREYTLFNPIENNSNFNIYKNYVVLNNQITTLQSENAIIEYDNLSIHHVHDGLPILGLLYQTFVLGSSDKAKNKKSPKWIVKNLRSNGFDVYTGSATGWVTVTAPEEYFVAKSELELEENEYPSVGNFIIVFIDKILPYWCIFVKLAYIDTISKEFNLPIDKTYHSYIKTYTVNNFNEPTNVELTNEYIKYNKEFLNQRIANL